MTLNKKVFMSEWFNRNVEGVLYVINFLINKRLLLINIISTFYNKKVILLIFYLCDSL